VSVVGPAGIGKTRLAQAVAHPLRASYADGVWLVELAPLADPLLVVPTVARVLGHAIAQEEGALTSLLEAMRDQRLLVVLDNCEHLLGAVVELATKIVAGAPGVQLLITSQEPLHLAEEQVDRLSALAVPPTTDAVSALDYGAVELFVARAQGADPRFALTAESVGEVVEVCKHLDGIALAIELAAARVPLLGVHGLRQRLDERLKLLAGGTRTALPRHQTLRAALQWSYGLLSAAEQTVFDRLGVFVGTFSLEAAQQVACDEAIDAWVVLDHLATLVDKSLVLVEGAEVPRYRLLESSRAFARERLTAAGSLEALRRRHAQAIADTVTGDDPFERPNARMRRIAPDLDNVRAAVAWATGPTGDRQIAIAVAAATDMLWAVHGRGDEGDRLYRSVEPWVDESTPLLLAARLWFAVCNLGLVVGLRRQAEAGLNAARLFRTLGDKYWLFRAQERAARSFSMLGDHVAAGRALAEAERLLDPTWPSWLRAALEGGLGTFEYFGGRPEEARKHAAAALELSWRAGGEGHFANQSEILMLVVDYELGDFAAVVRRSGDLLGRGTSGQAMVLVWRGAALTGLGNLEEAEKTFHAALALLKRAVGSAAWIFHGIAYLLARQGRMEDAARLIGYSDVARTTQSVVKPLRERSYDTALVIITPALGATEFERLRAEGRELTEDEAIAVAFPTRT
jgi:predicted ATPase